MPAMPSTSCIEVEQKFVMLSEARVTKQLRTFGAVLGSEKTITDVYYDNEQHALTLLDHWLRKRDGVWELKCPPENISHESGVSTLYAEHTDHQVITDTILKKLNVNSSCHTVEELLYSVDLTEFCTIETNRKTFNMDGFTIVLDKTDFNFQIGEIELVVDNGTMVMEAVEKIEQLAAKLGFQNKTKIPGKIGAYLEAHNPQHYEQLVKAFILPENNNTLENMNEGQC